MGIQANRPAWWQDEHTGRWDRAKEALKRDWQQTRHDLHMGGHELNQSLKETVKQAQGAPMPPIDRANPGKVVGDASDWQRAEESIRYGHGARAQYGAQHPRWTDELEGKLRSEWTNIRGTSGRAWEEEKQAIRHGYEYDDRAGTSAPRERPSQRSIDR